MSNGLVYLPEEGLLVEDEVICTGEIVDDQLLLTYYGNCPRCHGGVQATVASGCPLPDFFGPCPGCALEAK